MTVCGADSRLNTAHKSLIDTQQESKKAKRQKVRSCQTGDAAEADIPIHALHKQAVKAVPSSHRQQHT
jgi:uncharacterized protein YecT (DUF1311 family)